MVVTSKRGASTKQNASIWNRRCSSTFLNRYSPSCMMTRQEKAARRRRAVGELRLMERSRMATTLKERKKRRWRVALRM